MSEGSAAPAGSQAAGNQTGTQTAADGRQTAAAGETRPAAAAGGQNGTAPVDNQSIAADAPAARRPGANALNPPPDNNGARGKQAPDWLPDAEKFWDGQTGTVKLREMGESYKELRKRLSMRTDDLQKAMDSDRRSRVPAKPADYKLELGKDYLGKLQQHGFKGDPTKLVDPADPMTRMLAAVAHRHGLDQDAFSDVLNHYHFTKNAMRPDPQAEAIKLGENSRERAGAVQQFLVQSLGKEDTNYLISAAGGPTARFIQIMERLMEVGGGRSFMPPGAGSQPSGAPLQSKAELQKTMMTDAYNNPRHPDHARLQREVADGFRRLAGGRQLATAQRDHRMRPS